MDSNVPIIVSLPNTLHEKEDVSVAYVYLQEEDRSVMITYATYSLILIMTGESGYFLLFFFSVIFNFVG